MAERNQKVFERVRKELEKNPALGSRELYNVAQTVDKAIAQDSMQQFHARYFLPARRELRVASGEVTEPKARRAKPGKGGQAKRSAAAPKQATRASSESRGETGSRDRIRGVLLQFAQELTDAESRSSLVKVLGRVDSYVDRIEGAQK